MSERLTKAALKTELTRRIEWYEKAFKFTPETDRIAMQNRNKGAHEMYGRYRTLLDIRWQIENNLFIGGFAA